eukprot:TRINITY_DN11040_c0_g1_i1.p2 TRINITY_DN11040_c0_g1~~TRINITY_DN11040_c0_g1_i1.p2  ORF type:complete len:103 (-),score=11.37 TRINITY_DN11040_c0_g1_i1:213-521(-)
MRLLMGVIVFFFFNDTATTEIYTRSIVGSVRCVQETDFKKSKIEILHGSSHDMRHNKLIGQTPTPGHSYRVIVCMTTILLARTQMKSISAIRNFIIFPCTLR